MYLRQHCQSVRFLHCRATRVGEDTTLSQIIQMVSDAAATKAPIAKIADRVSGVFVPAVITIAVVTTAVWLVAGQSVGFALGTRDFRAGHQLSLCAGSCNAGSNHGRQWYGCQKRHSVQNMPFPGRDRKTQIVALDKTGTITSGEPKVTDILPASDVREKDLLYLAPMHFGEEE